jgi:hypothetical protein
LITVKEEEFQKEIEDKRYFQSSALRKIKNWKNRKFTGADVTFAMQSILLVTES